MDVPHPKKAESVQDTSVIQFIHGDPVRILHNTKLPTFGRILRVGIDDRVEVITPGGQIDRVHRGLVFHADLNDVVSKERDEVSQGRTPYRGLIEPNRMSTQKDPKARKELP